MQYSTLLVLSVSDCHKSDVPPPKSLPSDDEHTNDWVESLRQLVIMSNIACRIMRFNYAAQTQFSGPLRVTLFYLIFHAVKIALFGKTKKKREVRKYIGTKN